MASRTDCRLFSNPAAREPSTESRMTVPGPVPVIGGRRGTAQLPTFFQDEPNVVSASRRALSLPVDRRGERLAPHRQRPAAELSELTYFRQRTRRCTVPQPGRGFNCASLYGTENCGGEPSSLCSAPRWSMGIVGDILVRSGIRNRNRA